MRLTCTPFDALALTLAAGFAACAPLDSTALDTADVSPEAVIESDGDGALTVTAWLHAGSLTSSVFVALAAGDALLLHGAQATERLEPLAAGEPGAPAYVGVLAQSPDAPAGAETQLALEFDRADPASRDAPLATVRMPAPFELSAPSDAARLALGQDELALGWSNASPDRVEVRIAGDCFEEVRAELTWDAGRAVLPAALFTPTAAPGTACDAEIEVRRVRSAQVDEAFAPGRIVAAQVRRLSLPVVVPGTAVDVLAAAAAAI